MNGSDMRSKAAATFGKSFMDAAKPKPLAKNAAVASNKVSKDRPIPAFKVGGPVKADLPAVRKEAVMKRAGLMKDGGKVAKDIADRDRKDIADYKDSFLSTSKTKKMASDDAKSRRDMDPTYTNSANRVAASDAARKRLIAKYEAESGPVKKAQGGKPEKHVEGGRIGSRIMPISLRNPDAMGAGSGIGDMRASFGGVGGSMRPDYAGSQGRMMQDLDREGRMTGEAGSARGLGLRVGTRFKVGGKVSTSSDTARKLATEMGGMKCGGKAGKYAVGGAGKMRKGQCDTPTKLAKGGSPKKEPVTGGSNTPMTPERREILRMTAEENARNRAAMAKPEKKAKGGAGKVRKGMMSQTGQIMQAVKPGKGIGGK
jgi:hypothetical protein